MIGAVVSDQAHMVAVRCRSPLSLSPLFRGCYGPRCLEAVAVCSAAPHLTPRWHPAPTRLVPPDTMAKLRS